MTHMKLRFRETEQIIRFVKLMGDCIYDADIKYDHIVVDAKSLMGVLSVAAHKEVELVIHSSQDHSLAITSRLAAFAA